MEAGQLGLWNQVVVFLVVEEYSLLQGRVQIHHQMKLGSIVSENRAMRKIVMGIVVVVSSTEQISISISN